MYVYIVNGIVMVDGRFYILFKYKVREYKVDFK